jgi:fucose 4-O-acetylase-like acetyltransferase
MPPASSSQPFFEPPAPAIFVDPRPVSERLARSSRLTWVDTAKGFGIILVVLGHALRGLVSGEIITSTPLVRFIDDWIYAFHMPLFFFLSGLFLFRSTSTPWVDFAGDKLRRLAYPYFVWSIITLMFKAALGSATNHPEGLSDFRLILYQPIDQFWFLYSLFIITMTVSVLLKIGVKKSVVFGVSILIYPALLPISLFGLGIINMTRLMLIYFALGVIIGSDHNIHRMSSQPVWSLPAAVATGLAVSSLAGWRQAPYRDAFLPTATFAISGIIAILALALLIDKARLGAAFRLLGRYSLEIYLVHTIATAGVRVALDKVAHISAPAPHLVLGTLAGLYIPIGLALIFQRVDFRYGFTLPRTVRFNPIDSP